MMNSRLPPQALLDGVRHIAGWDHWFSAIMGERMGDKGRRSYHRDKLHSIMSKSELEIEGSLQKTKAILRGAHKLTYAVAHRGAVKLEFTDLLQDKTDLRTLESVRIYHAGEWEQKAIAAYQKCLDLSNQWNSVSRLVEELGSTSHTPEEIVELVEATGDPKETVRLLVLSDEWEGMAGVLNIAYAVLGRCREARFVLDTVISIYPENPSGYLLLGCLFRGALQNANPPPRGSISNFRKLLETTGTAGEEWLNEIRVSDPRFYRVLTDRERELEAEKSGDALSPVTLEALDCSWDFAYDMAEEMFREAMRRSRDKETKERARSALSSLKLYHRPG